MNIKVFVIHYKKLIERKKNIIEQFKKNNIENYEFIDIDRNEILIYDLSIFEKNWLLKDINIHKGCAIAVFLSHYKAYKEAAEKYDKILILEDDSILVDNFSEKLNKYLEQLPDNYDMLHIGEGCNLHIPKEDLVEGKYIYKKDVEPSWWGGAGATRCASAYLVSNKCSKEVCKYIEESKYNKYEKVDNFVDLWLNRVYRDKYFNIYWAEPTIVLQGSEDGTYKKSY